MAGSVGFTTQYLLGRKEGKLTVAPVAPVAAVTSATAGSIMVGREAPPEISRVAPPLSHPRPHTPSPPPPPPLLSRGALAANSMLSVPSSSVGMLIMVSGGGLGVWQRLSDGGALAPSEMAGVLPVAAGVVGVS